MYRDDEDELNIDDYSQSIDNNQSSNEVFNSDNEYNYDYSLNDNDVKNNQDKNSKLYGIIGIILIIIIIILLASCTRQKKNLIPSMEIIGEERYIRVNERINLDVKLVNNSNNNIIWRTIDEKIADVDSDGIVLGVCLGKTSIEASYKHKDNKEYLDSCIINVYQGDIGTELLGISLDDQIKMKVGDTKIVNIGVEPINAYVDSIFYEMNDETIATIDNNGNVTGVNVGETSLKVTVNNKYSETVKVIVYQDNDSSDNDNEDNNNNNNNNDNDTTPTGIEFIDKNVSIMVNEEKLLNYKIIPNGAKGNVVFKNSNDTVLRINSNGKIMGISMGKTIITAMIGDNIKTSIEVIVNPYIVRVDNVKISSSKNLSLNLNNTSQITYDIAPNYASNKAVVFKSNNENVATVDTNGLIKAIGSGSCVITVTTVDGNKEDTINVTIN